MQSFLDAFIQVWLTLVKIGLSPLEIATVIVAAVLYRKTEQLDAALHRCLDDKARSEPETIMKKE